MTLRHKWFWYIVFFAPIVWLIWATFYPGRVVVHYDNPEQPIYIILDNEDHKPEQERTLEKGTAVLYLKRFYTRWDSYFATLSWGKENPRKLIDGIGFEMGAQTDNAKGVLDLDACRVDVYLDKDAKLIRTEVKHPLVLYACW